MPVKFKSGQLTLEGEWHLPEGTGPHPAVVVCHPYPPGGGSMHNSVVIAVCEALQKRNIVAFRFNFRGVGESDGRFDQGTGEREDARAALDYVISDPNTDSERIGLAGYSFGAMISLPAAAGDDRVKMLAMISAPLSEDGLEMLKKYGRPRLYIIGSMDQMIPPLLMRDRMKGIASPGQYKEIPGADHFMVGREAEPASLVAEFFAGGFIRS